MSAKPLDDIHNTKIAGVVLSGRWFPGPALQARADSLANAFAEGQRLVDSLLAPGSARYVASHATTIPTFGLSTVSQVMSFLMRAKRWDDAIAVGELLTQRYPTSAGALAQLGDAYAGGGRNGAATSAYEKALVLNPSANDVRKKLDALRHSPPSPQGSRSAPQSTHIDS